MNKTFIKIGIVLWWFAMMVGLVLGLALLRDHLSRTRTTKYELILEAREATQSTQVDPIPIELPREII